HQPLPARGQRRYSSLGRSPGQGIRHADGAVRRAAPGQGHFHRMMALTRRLLPSLIPLLLTACAAAPQKPVPVAPAPAPSVASVQDVSMSPKLMRPPSAPDFWSEMRDSFAMPGCEAGPEVVAWARTYTKMPNRFEQQVNEVLPLIVYAHKSAQQHSVAGEFAL